MIYRRKYTTPEGFSDIMMESDGRHLTALWFFDALAEGESYRYTDRFERSSERAEAVSEAGSRKATGNFSEGADDASEAVPVAELCNVPVLDDTVRWLDEYFSGRWPDFTPDYKLVDATPFRRAVSERMCRIPYGETVTYGEIAADIRAAGGSASAIAVGGAVGWNPICLIIPCHRVLGSDGSITGYGGGVSNKVALLKMEGAL